ncbi:MAG: hypothetical protein PHV02_03725 [Rhodocyclaceae bacterium]|nr:hypothetical protein [Rhodocyclaceae bacterium]
MHTTPFATWKYKHDGPGYRHPKQRPVAAVLLLGALLAQFALRLTPLAIPLFLLALIVFFFSTKKLLLGPRYLICGSTLIYFNNVTRIMLDQSAGRLSLTTLSQQNFTLEREKFPTNARKADKISKNKAAKFDKVSKSVIDKVRRAVPDVQTSGIS